MARASATAAARLSKVARTADRPGGRPPEPTGRAIPNPKQLKKRKLNETPEQREMRLRAKTINFTATFIARTVIILALAYFLNLEFQRSGDIDRRFALGLIVMILDYGRVIMKALEPGTK